MLNFINIVQAQGSALGNAPGIDLTLTKLTTLINRLACWITDVALILIVVAVIYYGIMFLISRGDPTKVTNARKALGWGVVGILVILGAYTIIASVGNAIQGSGFSFPTLNCGSIGPDDDSSSGVARRITSIFPTDAIAYSTTTIVLTGQNLTSTIEVVDSGQGLTTYGGSLNSTATQGTYTISGGLPPGSYNIRVAGGSLGAGPSNYVTFQVSLNQ